MSSTVSNAKRPVLSILIPMAGRGERFLQRGFREPKPLIPVYGREMIQRVVANLRPASTPHRFIFVCLEDHLRRFPLASELERWAGPCEVIAIPEVSSGAAVTALSARNHIDDDAPLMIANCDQLVRVSIQRYLDSMDDDRLDGLIMTMRATDPKWSFVRRGSTGAVVEVAEKVPISDEATVGIYNFRRGADFCRAADTMIRKGITTRGEFYVAPVYNELIAEGMRVGAYALRAPDEAMYGIGTPEDLDAFHRDPEGRRLADALDRP